MAEPTKLKITEEQTRKAFRKFHAGKVNLTPDFRPTAEAIAERTAFVKGQVKDGLSEARVVEGMRYVGRILDESTEDEWVSFIHNGEPPTLKMGPAEMESLRGGEIAISPAIGVGAIMLEGLVIYWFYQTAYS